MRYRNILRAGAIIGLAIMCGNLLRAQIITDGPTELDADGAGRVELRLEDHRDNIAGLQGRILFDPSRLEPPTLSLPLEQPDSFTLSVHALAPGEMRFVLYSTEDVLHPERPFLHCDIAAKAESIRKGLDSVLICEVEMTAFPDIQAQSQRGEYMNIPLRMAPSNQGNATWLGVY